MKYHVVVRHRTFSDDVELDTIERGDLVADVYRVEWFGLKRTLIGRGISASMRDFEAFINHDVMKMRPVRYDFESEMKRKDNVRIW